MFTTSAGPVCRVGLLVLVGSVGFARGRDGRRQLAVTVTEVGPMVVGRTLRATGSEGWSQGRRADGEIRREERGDGLLTTVSVSSNTGRIRFGELMKENGCPIPVRRIPTVNSWKCTSRRSVRTHT